MVIKSQATRPGPFQVPVAPRRVQVVGWSQAPDSGSLVPPGSGLTGSLRLARARAREHWHCQWQAANFKFELRLRLEKTDPTPVAV